LKEDNGLTDTDKNNLISAFTSVDWTKSGALEQFKQFLESFGLASSEILGDLMT